MLKCVCLLYICMVFVYIQMLFWLRNALDSNMYKVHQREESASKAVFTCYHSEIEVAD